MGKPSTWDDEKTEKLIEMHKENKLSTKEMGVILGYSKNAIIGKLFRLGLTDSSLNRKGNMHKTDNKNKPEKKEKSVEVKKLTKLEESAMHNLSLEDFYNKDPYVFRQVKYEKGKVNIEHIEYNMCAWPYGDEKFTFCGEKVVKDKVYCEEHMKEAYLKIVKGDRRKASDIFTKADLDSLNESLLEEEFSE
jgi:GcrA cell cycle regulator